MTGGLSPRQRTSRLCFYSKPKYYSTYAPNASLFARTAQMYTWPCPRVWGISLHNLLFFYYVIPYQSPELGFTVTGPPCSPPGNPPGHGGLAAQRLQHSAPVIGQPQRDAPALAAEDGGYRAPAPPCPRGPGAEADGVLAPGQLAQVAVALVVHAYAGRGPRPELLNQPLTTSICVSCPGWRCL